jgi:NAD(P)-dependent dehydrogenase (short-subunit alcohol dehydrogenase family)
MHLDLREDRCRTILSTQYIFKLASNSKREVTILLTMYWIQPPIPSLPEGTSLAGKTAIITGATAGLGLEVARQFLQLGVSTLVLAVRNILKGDAARLDLLADPIVQRVNPSPTVLVYELDMSSNESVVAFAQKITAELAELNVLLLNAGINGTSWTVSPSTQNEMILQVNVLSNALLSIMLLPLLKSSAKLSDSPSRITFVGSQAQEFNSLSKLDFPTSTPLLTCLNDPLICSAWTRYSDSKLLLSMWVNSLASHLDSSKVTVNVLCPGIVYTGITSNTPCWMRAIMSVVMTIFARSLDSGGRAIVYATAVAGEGSHGKMIVNNQITG